MIRRLALPLLIACALAPTAAFAEGTLTSIGPRFGFSVDPDQLIVGGQVGTGELADHVTFNPNLELGFGDDMTVIAINMDFQYHLTLNDSNWAPYVGFGPAISFIQVDRPFPFEDDSDTEVGGNFLVGAEVPTSSGSKFLTELKLGLGDVPSLKLVAGWNFALGGR